MQTDYCDQKVSPRHGKKQSKSDTQSVTKGNYISHSSLDGEMNFFVLKVNYIHDEHGTAAQVMYPGHGYFTGLAKRAPGDRHDFEVGLNIATARALRKLADEVERVEHQVVDYLNA